MTVITATNKIDLASTNTEMKHIWRYYLDLMSKNEFAMLTKTIFNQWVFRIIFTTEMWEQFKPWFEEELFIKDDQLDAFDRHFLHGDEKVYAIMRYSYFIDPQRSADWIDTFLILNDHMKKKYIV